MIDEKLLLFQFNLQLFAEGDTGEKTEKATPRRREEARKKGQIFKSADLSSAAILLAGSMALYISFPYMVSNLQQLTSLYLLDRGLYEFSNQFAYNMLLEVLMLMGKIVFPIMLATFLAALLINFLQVGFVFSSESLTPNFARLNPVEGFKRIFSKRALVEFCKSILKIGITGYIAYSVISKYYYIFPRFVDMEMGATLAVLGRVVFEIAVKVGIVFVVIGLADYIYQWWEYENSLKMSKYEVKQEFKQIEGDPVVKSRQRQIQRQFATRRMMAEVPKADVVITNPTHFAVVLKYEGASMAAPVVVAKGQDYMAMKIKEIAAGYKVIIVENPVLARTLYYSLQIGDMIPEELYQVVAEVLAFVYKQKKMVI